MRSKDLCTKAACFLLIFFFLGNDLMASTRAMINFGSYNSVNAKDISIKKKDRLVRETRSLPENSDRSGARPSESPVMKATLVFSAEQKEAYLGKHEKDPMNMPANDIFTLEVGPEAENYRHVYLQYRISGLEDGLSIPKSVNGTAVYTGLPLEEGEGEWQEIRFELEKKDLRQGKNQVRFNLPRYYNFPVTVRDVRIEFTDEEYKTRSMIREVREMASPEDFKVLKDEEDALKAYKVKEVDMPAIPGDIRNVSRKGGGFLLNSSTDKVVKVSVGVDKRLIASGRKLSDVQLFYFDKEKLLWRPVHTQHVDMAASNIQGSVPSNTNYFAGLISAPEMPEANAFVPTAISDIKAANPAAGMNIMQPPTISNTGEASIQYPLEIPAGRNGMQPDLTLSYSSDAGTGWLGVGWNINVPQISIDSRWGVPTFPGKQEEVYLLNGNSLTEDNGRKGNRNPGTRQPGDVHFFEPVRNSYKEVIRKGTSPANYRWVEISADQTKYYYGTEDGSGLATDAVLTDGTNIIKWYLKKVEDKWGNNIIYYYHILNSSGGMKQGGKKVVPSRIEYTGFNDITGKYAIEFDISSGSRTDASVSLASGVKEVDDRLLEAIRVFYNDEDEGEIEIKRFEFNYQESQPGSFYKTLLTSVEEYRSDNFFYNHDFEYYPATLSYSSPETIDVDHFNNSMLDDVVEDIAQLVPSLSTQLFPSPLSTSSTFGWGAGGTVGVGVAPIIDDIAQPTKGFTFSGRFGYSESYNREQYTLNDINGDGLPDVVFRRGGGSRYLPLRQNGSGGLSLGNYGKIDFNDRLMKSSSGTFSYGFDFVLPFGLFYYGRNWNKTNSETTTYVTDYNADGIQDIVQGQGNGIVYFGKVHDNGDVHFSHSSETTLNPVIQGETIAEDITIEETLKDLEIVRVWEAPFNGTVNITGWAELVGETEDMVSVGVQKNNAFIYSMQLLGPYEPMEINLSGQSVDKGDKLLFRIRANEDGYNDLVKWNPRVTYTGLSKTDANDINYTNSSYEEGFLLSAGEGVSFSGNENVSVSWPGFQVGPFTDDVILRVNLSMGNPANGQPMDAFTYEATIPAGSTTFPSPGNFYDYWQGVDMNLSSIPGLQSGYVCHLSFEVYSYSNIRWKDLDWRPEVTIASGDCSLEKKVYPVVSYQTWNKVEKMDAPFHIPDPAVYRTWPELDEGSLQSLFSDSSPEYYTAYFVTKKKMEGFAEPGSRMVMQIYPGHVEYYEVPPLGEDPSQQLQLWDGPHVNSFMVDMPNDIFTEFYTDNKQVAAFFREQVRVGLYREIGGGFNPEQQDIIEFNVFCRHHNELQDYYLHWGQFCWSDSLVGIIDTADLHLAAQQVAEDNDHSNGSAPDPQDLEALENDMNPMNWQFFTLTARRGENTGRIRDYILDYRPSPTPKDFDRWIALGTHVGIYARDGATAPGKFGERERPASSSEPGVPDPQYGASAIVQWSKSLSLGESVGVGTYVNSRTINKLKYHNTALSSFMDINGDGYPDILKSKSGLAVQLTNSLGGYRTEHNYSGNHTITYSVTENDGQSVSGGFVNNDARFAKNKNLSGSDNFGFNLSKTEWIDINGDGLADRVNTDRESPGSPAEAELNTGRGLLPAAGLGINHHNVSSNRSVSLGGGLSNLDNSFEGTGLSFSGGVGLNRVGSKSQKLFIDLNGDNLPDMLRTDAGNAYVYLNTGAGFIQYTGGSIQELQNANTTDATGLSAHIAGTYSFAPFKLLFVKLKIAISASLQGNFAINKLRSAMRDMNGDGVLDYVESDEKGDLKVYYGQVGKSNLLRTVINPLRGGFTIDYKREGNKYGHYATRVKTHETQDDDRMVWDMPDSKWTMSRLDIFDGLDIVDAQEEDLDGKDTLTYHFAYDGGVKSRREREFLGFTRTEVRHKANREEPILSHPKEYITEVTDYARPLNNDPSYRKRFVYMKGLLTDRYTLHHKETLEQEDLPGGGFHEVYKHYISLMHHTENSYVYKQVSLSTGLATETDVNWETVSETQTVFPALSTVKNISVPQITSAANFYITKDSINYDPYFNVKRYMQEASDATQGVTDTELEPMIVSYYEYDVREYGFMDIIQGNIPFDNPSTDLETGMACHTITGDPGYEPETFCVPAYFDQGFLDNINGTNPCYSDSGLYNEQTRFEIVLRKPVTDTIHRRKKQYNTTYHGALIAVMEYHDPIVAEGQTGLLQSHTIYFGETVPDSIKRYTTVENLQYGLAPSEIRSHLNDSNYAKTEIEYSDKGNVIRITGPGNLTQQSVEIEYTYDDETEQFITQVYNTSYGESSCFLYDPATGNLLKHVDINGHTTAYTYDEVHRLERVFGPREYSDPTSAATLSFTYHPAGINPGSGHKYDKVPVAFTYHNINGDAQVQEPPGEFYCESISAGLEELAGRPSTEGMVEPLHTITFMDGMQRVVQVKKDASKNVSGANGTHREVSGITAYDYLGRKKEMLLSTEDNIIHMGRLTVNPGPLSLQIEYDYASRLLKQQEIREGGDYVSTNVSYNWDFLIDSKSQFYVESSKDGYATKSYYDPRNNVVATTQFGAPIMITRFRYDPLQQLKRVEDPIGQVTNYDYDNFGRMIREVHPDRGPRDFTYDPAGNLIHIASAENLQGITMDYHYNRLVQRTFPKINDINNVTYAWGSPGDGINGAGRVVEVLQGHNFKNEQYEYDELGNRIREHKEIYVTNGGPRQYETRFQYDSWGRMQWIEYPDNEEVEYTYALAGELESIASVSGPGAPRELVSQVLYDGFGNIKELHYGNGTHTTFNYNANTRRMEDVFLYTDLPNHQGNAILTDKTLEYDARGNVRDINNLSPIYYGGFDGTTQMGGYYHFHDYEYDGANRLVSVAGNFNGGSGDRDHNYHLTMGYNVAGGITSKEQVHDGSSGPFPESQYNFSYTYHEMKPHQVQLISGDDGTREYQYNDEGSLTDVFLEDPSAILAKYRWDEMQQMKSFIMGDGVMHHCIYDQNGERILKGVIRRSSGGNNGEGGTGGFPELDVYTLYVNPYYVVNNYENRAEGSKHYYMGRQRVASTVVSYTQATVLPYPLDPTAPDASGAVTDLYGEISWYADNGPEELDIVADFQAMEVEDFIALLETPDIEVYYDEASYNEDAGPCEGDWQCLCEQSQYWAEHLEGINCIEVRVTYWYHPDYLGSTEWVTNSDGRPQQYFWYSPWGEVLQEDHSGRGRFSSRYKFNAKELDEETGLYYYGARYYNPQISMWLSVDPLASKFPHMTPYAYVNNNPVNLIDPTGMEPVDYFDVDGNKIGSDGNDADKRNFVVANNKEVKAIKKAEKNNTHIALNKLSSAKESPSKASIRDGVEALDKTIAVGGDQEYSSTTMSDGTTISGGYGPKINVNYAKGTITGESTTANLPPGTTVADIASVNHSHPTKVLTAPNGVQFMAGNALVPSPTDKAGVMNFSGFNIISGPLGSGTRYSNGSFLPPPNGLAIYKGGGFSHQFTRKAAINFISNARW